jgi:hypothetical protein
VSPLWRDEIGIYLAPHKLSLTRLARGMRPRQVAQTGWVNDVAGDSHWTTALGVLDTLLANPEWRQAAVRIVVADHWVRYAMVPWAAALSGDAERMTHARHVLADIYGDVVNQWKLTLSDSPPGNAQVACALPAALLEDLQLLLTRHRLTLVSLQPQLVSAFNHWRDKLPDGGAWFVSIEQGTLAAARIGTGGWWDRVHSVRIGADWAVELRRLQTFGRLANNSVQEGNVYVDVPAGLRIAAGASASDLVWLEEDLAGDSTAGKIEFARRHQA